MFRGWAVIKRKEKLSRAQALDAVPVKNQAASEAEGKEGGITLTLHRQETLFVRFISKFLFVPREKKISLDKLGSWVWKKCDGKTPVSKILNQMSEEFRLSRKEAEVSLMSFLKSLSSKKLIGFSLQREDLEQKKG